MKKRLEIWQHLKRERPNVGLASILVGIGAVLRLEKGCVVNDVQWLR